jgi:hypothetical protein
MISSRSAQGKQARRPAGCQCFAAAWGLGQRQAIGRISAIDSAIRVFQLTESRLSILS